MSLKRGGFSWTALHHVRSLVRSVSIVRQRSTNFDASVADSAVCYCDDGISGNTSSTKHAEGIDLGGRIRIETDSPEALAAVHFLRFQIKDDQTGPLSVSNWTLIQSAGNPCRTSRMSRPRLAAETRRRRFKLALESPVEGRFRFVPDFGSDLRHRIIGRSHLFRS